jgi:hypothetical protein
VTDRRSPALYTITSQPGSLQSALLKARQFGWYLVRGDLISIAKEVTDTVGSLHIVRPRKTDDTVQLLRPQSHHQAAARSLSARHGRGAFPFHTDGAHLEMPPDFVLLAAKRVGQQTVPTHLLRFPSPSSSPETSEDMRLGVFRIDTGITRFYATGRYADGASENCVRFDPGCMNPVDPRSRRLIRTVTSTAPDHTHAWSDQGEILIIDNHHVLHSRGDANQAPDRAIYRLLLLWDVRTR